MTEISTGTLFEDLKSIDGQVTEITDLTEIFIQRGSKDLDKNQTVVQGRGTLTCRSTLNLKGILRPHKNYYIEHEEGRFPFSVSQIGEPVVQNDDGTYTVKTTS